MWLLSTYSEEIAMKKMTAQAHAGPASEANFLEISTGAGLVGGGSSD